MKLYQKIKKLFKRKSAAKNSKSKDGATVKRLTQCPHCPECIKQIEKNQALSIKLYNMTKFPHEYNDMVRLNELMRRAIENIKTEQQRQKELNERLRKEHEAYVCQLQNAILKQQANSQPWLNNTLRHHHGVQETASTQLRLNDECNGPVFGQRESKESGFHPQRFINSPSSESAVPYQQGDGGPSGVCPSSLTFYIGNSAFKFDKAITHVP